MKSIFMMKGYDMDESDLQHSEAGESIWRLATTTTDNPSRERHIFLCTQHKQKPQIPYQHPTTSSSCLSLSSFIDIIALHHVCFALEHSPITTQIPQPQPPNTSFSPAVAHGREANFHETTFWKAYEILDEAMKLIPFCLS